MRRGISLIEVLAGITLLCTLMVSVMLTWHQHWKQVAGLQQRLAAMEAIEQQLTIWYDERGGPPVNATGPMRTLPEAVWRTQVSGAQPEGLPAGIVSVEVTVINRQQTTLARLFVLATRPANSEVPVN